jgi:hypothetical protein
VDRERFARPIQLLVAAGDGNHRGFHRHGIEPGLTSKFWAKNTDEDSSSKSMDDEQTTESEEDTTMSTLVSKALYAGFSLDQIKHIEAELDSPPQSSTKVHTNLRQGSISKQIVDVWIMNCKGKVKPWSSPLPSP